MGVVASEDHAAPSEDSATEPPLSTTTATGSGSEYDDNATFAVAAPVPLRRTRAKRTRSPSPSVYLGAFFHFCVVLVLTNLFTETQSSQDSEAADPNFFQESWNGNSSLPGFENYALPDEYGSQYSGTSES